MKFYWPHAATEAYDDFRNILFLFKISKRTKEQKNKQKKRNNTKNENENDRALDQTDLSIDKRSILKNGTQLE
jgi:hypothetical protein